jgi:hypothetical protein
MNIQWSNFRIQQLNSDKLFFNKYHYKLEITLALAACLRSKTRELTKESVRGCRDSMRDISYNFGGSWHYYSARNSRVGDANNTDVNEIIDVGTIARAIPNLKYIILDDSVHMFSDDEQQLYDIASRINKKVGRLGTYAAIWAPAPIMLAAIEAGHEILSKDPGYSHKVVLRDRLLGNQVKTQIYNYLLSLDDQIKLSACVRLMLTNKGSYLYGCWFRTNEPSITTFLELMVPGIVQKIMPVHIKNK